MEGVCCQFDGCVARDVTPVHDARGPGDRIAQEIFTECEVAGGIFVPEARSRFSFDLGPDGEFVRQVPPSKPLIFVDSIGDRSQVSTDRAPVALGVGGRAFGGAGSRRGWKVIGLGGEGAGEATKADFIGPRRSIQGLPPVSSRQCGLLLLGARIIGYPFERESLKEIFQIVLSVELENGQLSILGNGATEFDRRIREGPQLGPIGLAPVAIQGAVHRGNGVPVL